LIGVVYDVCIAVVDDLEGVAGTVCEGGGGGPEVGAGVLDVGCEERRLVVCSRRGIHGLGLGSSWVDSLVNETRQSDGIPLPAQLVKNRERWRQLTSNRLNGIQIRTLTLSQYQRNGISRSSRRSPCDVEWCTSSNAGERCEGKWVLGGRKSSDGREDEGC